MDDSARGMASKIICDLLNISKTDSVSANSGSNNGGRWRLLNVILEVT